MGPPPASVASAISGVLSPEPDALSWLGVKPEAGALAFMGVLGGVSIDDAIDVAGTVGEAPLGAMVVSTPVLPFAGGVVMFVSEDSLVWPQAKKRLHTLKHMTMDIVFMFHQPS